MTTPTITAEAYAQAIAYRRQLAEEKSRDVRPGRKRFAETCAEKVRMLDSIVSHAAELTAVRASEGQGEARNASGVERGVALWQPIETAPKDGNCLLAVATDSGYEFAVLRRDKKGHWIHEGEPTFSHGYYYEPTHWMPLPDPPDAAIEQQKSLGETAIQFAPQKTVRDVMRNLVAIWREDQRQLGFNERMRCADELEAALGENGKG